MLSHLCSRSFSRFSINTFGRTFITQCIKPSSLSFSRQFSAAPEPTPVGTTKEQIREMILQASSDLKKQADDGNAESQANFGHYIETGKINITDMKEAVRYYKLSADHNCPNGLLNYGRVLLRGKGIAKDEKLGLHYINKAAGLDYGPAQLLLGNIYFDGTETVKKDHIKSARYFKMAADKGIKSAQNSYGFMLLKGDGVQKDEELAAEYFKKSADQGDSEGQTNYAKMLCENANDIQQAIDYFEKAADNGSIDALIALSSLYLKGKGVTTNFEKARQYAKRAADTNDPKGHMAYGYFLEQIKDFGKAFEEYKTAANAGEVTSMGNIARLYQFGLGCKVDLKNAMKYFKMAADKGDPNSANSYAFLLQKGQAGPPNPDEIVKYYQIAVKANHTVAMNNLGILYLKGGAGVKQNTDEAIKLFKQAAESGNLTGYLNIGVIYEKGIGKPQNIEMAKKFYQLVADKGDPFAMKLLQKFK